MITVIKTTIFYTTITSISLNANLAEFYIYHWSRKIMDITSLSTYYYLLLDIKKLNIKNHEKYKFHV